MTEYELMKLSEEFDEAVNYYDFTAEEIAEMARKKGMEIEKFKEKYFDYYDDIKHNLKKKQDW